jgi:hypothetical protein
MTKAARTLTCLVPGLIRCSMRHRISPHSLVNILIGCLLHSCFSALSLTALAQTESANGAKSNNISTPSQPASTPGRFIDITTKSHLSLVGQASHTSKKYLLETMGSGVALLDYDNDGLLDVFFCQRGLASRSHSEGNYSAKDRP